MYFPFIVRTKVLEYFDIMYKRIIRNVIWCIMTPLFHLLLCTNCDEKTSYCNMKECCKTFISLSLIDFDQNKDDFKKYDGKSEDDIVRNQYKLLPYPPVSEEQLKKEEQFYLENRNRMYHNYNILDLESLNHHLYRGQNDFR